MHKVHFSVNLPHSNMYKKSLVVVGLLLNDGSAFHVFNSANGKTRRQYTNGETFPVSTKQQQQQLEQQRIEEQQHNLNSISQLTDQPAKLDSTNPPNAKDPFTTWTQMRTGLYPGPGSSPSVFWVGGGALYEGYSGKQLAIFEGFDVGRGVQLSENHVRQISRKIFWFRDPVTQEVMTEYEGKPVLPIVYNCQVIDYHRNEKDGKITYSVVASLRDLKDMPKMEISCTDAGPDQMMIHVPVFVDIPTGKEGGRYQAWEFYDYTVDPTYPKERPATAVWCRQGSVPPFNTDSNAVLRFSGHRVDEFEGLPERMRMLVEEKYPHFMYPPLDEEEMEEFFAKKCRGSEGR